MCPALGGLVLRFLPQSPSARENEIGQGRRRMGVRVLSPSACSTDQYVRLRLLSGPVLLLPECMSPVGHQLTQTNYTSPILDTRLAPQLHANYTMSLVFKKSSWVLFLGPGIEHGFCPDSLTRCLSFGTPRSQPRRRVCIYTLRTRKPSESLWLIIGLGVNVRHR
ncbi:hypothetical protein VTK26DRAFT_748 [Humicola hyalothermophila]